MPTDRHRLTAAEVAEFITHDDRDIRRTACDYLTEGFCATNDTWTQLLKAPEETNPQYLGPPRYLRSVPIPADAVPRLLDAANSCRDMDRDSYMQALALAPLDSFEGHGNLLRSLPDKGVRLQRQLDLRHEIQQQSGDEVWKNLTEISNQSKQADKYWSELDWLAINAHLDRLKELSCPDEDKIRELIGRNLAGDPWEWMNLFMICLAGRMGLKSAIPDLMNVLSCKDMEAEATEACTALIRIGPDCLPELRQRWSSLSTYAIDIPGKIKHPDAVDLAINCLEHEDDLETATWLGLALLDQIDSAGIEPVTDIIDGGRHAEWCTDLRKDIVPVLTMLEMEHPALDRWQQELRQEEQEWQRSSELQAGKLQHAHEWASEPHPDTIVNANAKVGRNDPCPCNSGKKYKKCCLKKSVDA